ncbi:MAG: right-handed parallel beta-helix repeat-containing protein [Alphaproteobacteria bacterium]|nr:right-handed parallel beta-helix repeat-containing protein [Alphaproteobacteria bacterium]
MPCAHYDPYIDLQGKVGNKRSIGEALLFAPLACSESQLLFLDVRPKIDTRDNYEGNIGLGYRSMRESGIWGGYGYFDRRRSGETGLFHSQLAFGTEWLTEDWEARLNTYIPITGKKATGAAVSSVPYLADTGIFIDTGGQTVEKALSGADIEFGKRFSLGPQIGDAWLHSGVYHFHSNDLGNTNGGRFRAEVDLGKSTGLSLVAEAQYDNKRHEQGWLGLRFRIPLGGTDKPATSQGLRARMTAPPVRDVDIVTAGVATALETVPVVSSADSQPQRVFHVDNSAASGGNGALHAPFDTLAAARVAADRVGDVIYVNRGLGDSTGMASGIDLAIARQALLGAGADFVYDSGRFSAPVAGDFAGTVLRAASAAPVLTSTAASTDVVRVLADNISIAGIDIAGAQRDGISIVNAHGTTVSNVNISGSTRYGIFGQSTTVGGKTLRLEDVTSSGNSNIGIFVQASGGGRWDDITLAGVTASQNTGRGVLIRAATGGTIGTVDISETDVRQNTGTTGRGIEFEATGAGSSIGSINIADMNAEENAQAGIYFLAQSSGVYGDVTVQNSVAAANANAGISILAQTGGAIGSLTLDGVTGRANTGSSGRGTYVNVTGAGSSLGALVARDSVFENNALQGFYAIAQSSGSIGDVTVQNSVAAANANAGISLLAQSAGTIGSLTLDGVTGRANTGGSGRGAYVNVTGAGSSLGALVARDSVFGNNAQQGLSVVAQSSGSIGDIDIIRNESAGNTGVGLQVTAQTLGQLAEVRLQDITATGNASAGVHVLAQSGGILGGTLDMQNVTSTGNTGGSGRGIYVLVSGAGTAVQDMSIAESVTSGNAQQGTYIVVQSGATAQDITLSANTSNNNDHTGTYLLVQSAATVGTVDISGLTASGNNTTANGRGLNVTATGAGSTIGDVDVRGSVFENNQSYGAYVVAGTSGIIGDVTLSDILTRQNTSTGTYVVAQGNGQIGNVSATNITAQNNTHAGFYLLSQSGGSLGLASFNNLVSENNTTSNGRGLFVNATGAGSSLAGVTVTDSQFSGNTVDGLFIQATSAGTLGDVALTGVSSTGNTLRGIYILSGTGSSIADISADDVQTSNNGQQGFYLRAQGGTLGATGIRNLLAQDNGSQGLRIETSGAAGRLLSVEVSDAVSSGNGATGIYLYSTDSSAIEAASFVRVTSTGNLFHGIYIDDDTTGNFVADLGGGVLGSIGQNRIFGNTGRDLRVDLDGLQLKAENNWWGTSAGLLAAQLQLDAGSTVDTAPFLAADPNP